MSPEAVDYVAKAEHALERARLSFEAGIYESAARDAYISALTAARAIIFDKTGVATKTHSGTRSELFRLIHEGLDFDARFAAFLRDAFELKQLIDYELTPVSTDRAEAEDFMKRAEAFLQAAKRVLEK